MAGVPEDAPLALQEWPAKAPRAVILALHGYGDHGVSAFAGPAPAWAEAGLTVRAYDLRGFGRNPDRGRWPGEERMLRDFAAAVAETRSAHPGLPVIALGESMGAAIAVSAVGEGLTEVDALVLSAPAIAGGPHLNDIQRGFAWLAAAIIPDRRFTGRGFVSFQASDDIEMLRALAADPLHIGAPTPREILGLLRLMDRAAAAAPQLRAPVLALIGARDELVEPDAMQAVAGSFPGPTKIVIYPEGWHLLMRDLQKERVWADVRDFALRVADGPA